MTTCAYSRKSKTIAVDSRNTDDGGSTYQCDKIERLSDGRYFLGAGHLLTIGMTKDWAESNFRSDAKPAYSEVLSDAEEYGFSCLIVSKDGDRVFLVDNETHPVEVLDDFLAVGSGAQYAVGAMLAGADVVQAVEIAISKDGNSGGPVRSVRISP